MATGTVKWFAQGLLDLGNKLHNLSSDALKMGIVTTGTVPAVSTTAPHWGGAGATNFATTQVATAGTAYTGPITLASVTWTLVSGVPTLKFTDISVAQDASGFSNGAYGIIYNNTDANKRCLGYVEINAAGAASLVSNPLSLSWSGTSQAVLAISQS